LYLKKYYLSRDWSSVLLNLTVWCISRAVM